MGDALVLVNGIPRMTAVEGVGANIYDETQAVPEGGYPADQIITLPNSGTYESADLEVYLNGQFLEESLGYDYVGAGDRTQIRILEAALKDERFRFRIEGNPATIYDEVYVIPGGGISTGVDITLPNSGEFGGDDLEVFLGGQFLEEGIDYNIIGAMAPYTQIEMTFDLLENERLRFRNDQ